MKWLGAFNIRNIVESYTQKDDNDLPNKTNLQELDKKLEKLLLTGENKREINKEK